MQNVKDQWEQKEHQITEGDRPGNEQISYLIHQYCLCTQSAIVAQNQLNIICSDNSCSWRDQRLVLSY